MTRWQMVATFDCEELEADGIADALIALLPHGSSVDLEPEE